jgi:hypothetical protein
MALDIYKLYGCLPEMVVLVETANISPFHGFVFWDWVKFWDRCVAFPGNPLVLGKYLGPSIDVGPAMMQCVMKANGKVEDRSTVWLLTPEECLSDGVRQEQEWFLTSHCNHWGQGTIVKDLGPDILNLVPDPTNYDPWEDEDGPSFPALDDDLAAADATGDYLIYSEVLLTVGNSHELARVVHQKSDANSVLVVTAHKQPALDSWSYEVCFPDGCSKELAANVIAEMLYAQCDEDGNEYVFLDSIVDYRCNTDVTLSCHTQVKVVDGKKMVARSTRGWELCCAWKDGITSWQKLSDLKESHPLGC